MLDENLPTFRFQPSKDSPTNTLLLFSERGSDPTPAFLLRRPDPAAPASRAKYALALADPTFPSIIIRRSPRRARMVPPVPDTVSLSLYDPDQTVVIRRVQSGWNRSESWEFEMPERTFKVPSASLLDRDQQADSAKDPTVPKIMFRWKKDGRISKDMTCYLVGRSVDGKKSREPDITIALFSQGKTDAVTIYEPNMRRVELEDRKGLEVVLLLGAEVIRSLYISPKADVFNLSGPGAASASPPGRRRKNSRPSTATPRHPRHVWRYNLETKRLQAAVAEDEKRKAKERERRDREEQERIRKMLKDEENERRRREAEIEKETERLRKEYGVEGQAIPAHAANNPPPGAWPQRPVSAGPYAYGQWAPPPPGGSGQHQVQFAAPPAQTQQPGPSGQGQNQHQGHKKKIEGLVSTLQPYAAEAAAGVSGLLHRNDKKKVQKKRSVHF
ncbi:hypothetical protein jhhlp_000085 [Lomentospora prolificans]|uniref:Uncharacterized protein n=1 Tax=Lomentospora prolificans TaxID=41688 RepID=A0A2N3NLK7_9PEZI|nr:hypothetical protein jhhlp_000085 [Lomentospora prolificans]